MDNVLSGGFDPIKNSKPVVCECGGRTFKEEYIIRKISALVSPTGKDEYMPLPLFVCSKCGKIVKEMIDAKYSGFLEGLDNNENKILQ